MEDNNHKFFVLITILCALILISQIIYETLVLQRLDIIEKNIENTQNFMLDDED